MDAKKVIAFAFAFIGFAVVACVCLALPTMLLWNAIIPQIFGLTQIDFWQALMLCALARCIIPVGTNSSK